MRLPSPFVDSYRGRPKILFIGLAQSTHTQAWINLIADQAFNIHLFGMPGGTPPEDWRIKTYLTVPASSRMPDTRKNMYAGVGGRISRHLSNHPRFDILRISPSPALWLKDIIETWKPDIIHTLGLYDEQGGLFYYRCRKKYHLETYGKWIVTLRGGSDLALRKHDPGVSREIRDVFMDCAQIITDNLANVDYIKKLGIPETKIASVVPVPGAGGIDVDRLASLWDKLPSQRERIILWPKAYESHWSKALPVFEALKLCWQNIQPCEVYMLATNPEAKMWFSDLPLHIRKHCHLHDRIEQGKVFELLVKARVMLAPSLVDGVPNSLYEAMACGAFPIVSPLDTIKSVVQGEQNVLFARNLYPHEIADVLIRAMTDDSLVDRGARANLKLGRRIADRKQISIRITDYYESLARPEL